MIRNDDEMKKQKNISEKIEAIAQLEQKIAKQQVTNEQKKHELKEFKRQYAFSERVIQTITALKKGTIKSVRSIGAYMLGRRNIKQLYSRTYKTKHAQNSLKSYKYNLYDLGFVEKGLTELKLLLEKTTNTYVYRACAWELALWYANQPTQDDAQLALNYLSLASKKEKNIEQLRRISIITAECLERINLIEAGKQIIQDARTHGEHPDLYLAAANLETSIQRRMYWINQALAMYQISPIGFSANDQDATYDDLVTEGILEQVTDRPKVSVILPTYNAGSGVRVAIESMLMQTWHNIELLVVDDCSTDDTVEVIREYMQNDDRIHLFSTEKNSGPYVARNIALKAATGEFVTVNDADDWSHATKIETQVKHLINNPDMIANSSEHSRLTESLQLYRRGTPGTYIFPNMSSIMFRREQVLEKLGYWDCVRFAADGEFKRRLIKTFGKHAIIDLKTGPLSLPRQSDASLTSSSKFGYSGFFMGARKEYVESLEHYHHNAKSLYYPYPPTGRPFPVPNPMLPNKKTKKGEERHFDVIIATDFYLDNITHNVIKKKLKIHKQMGISTGLIQLSCYNMTRVKDRKNKLRSCIDGKDVQMLVYGESITCDLLLVYNPATLQEKQTYIPSVRPHTMAIIIDRLPIPTGSRPNLCMYNFRQCVRHAMAYFDKQPFWYPADEYIQKKLQTVYKNDIKNIRLSNNIWLEDHNHYKKRLEDWLL